MITVDDRVTAALGRSLAPYTVSVQSWLGDQLLADDIPAAAAVEDADRGQAVPEKITLTVPRISRGAVWTPDTDDHPLACNGQRLVIRVNVGGVPVQRGVFVVADTDTDGDTVTVTAAGLLYLVQEARLVSPYQPSGTLVSTLRELVEPAVTVLVDDDLDDRATPSGINYDEDRLAAALALVDAWPAVAAVDPQGFLHLTPPADLGDPVLALTDGQGGTVIKTSGGSTRDSAYNAVVARGTAADGGQVQGVAYQMTGPKAYGGSFNPLPVPYYFESPLLTTVDQCTAAAQTILARLARQTGRQYSIDCVPDPRIQVGDVVTITSTDLSIANVVCTVEALSLPLQASSSMGPMTLKAVAVDE